MTTSGTVLVMGATGGIGGELARRLRDEGWRVRALWRQATPEPQWRDGIQWWRGDAMVRQDVLHAAAGCEVIVHAVNPPDYRQWRRQVLPMIDNSLAAAIAGGATVVLPGTVYNYGPETFPHVAEDAPQQPRTAKGALRVELEQRLEQATGQGARALVLRAGDFFGPRAGNNWFSQGWVKPGRRVKRITCPGRAGVGHSWAYLPDVAATVAALLAQRERLPRFARFHLRGHWDRDGRAMAAAITRAVTGAGQPAPRLARFPWPLLRLAAPWMPLLAEINEMRYLWQQPLSLDNTRLLQVLGHEPHTPLDEAVAATLVGLGCL